jgi:hypothetical protein
MERGFFHPDRGYWQTLSEPSVEVLATYPEGTVEVPLMPGRGHEWSGGSWIAVSPPLPTREQQEANRRAAYSLEADPLFFMSQRGEATETEWLAKIAEIKARYPYPVE